MLFERLSEVLAATRQDPLHPVEIVVQNPGMGRWISQQTALRNGIAANMQFPLPARFIWQILAGQLELDTIGRDFDRSVLLWRIFAELSSSPGKPATDIRKYLADDHGGRKVFHLAEKVADLYDQYLVYRPEMLLKWEAGSKAGWQEELWKSLTNTSNHHRAKYVELFLQMARNGDLNPNTLPQQAYIFGISSLAPVYLEVIHAISSSVDVYLFHLSPCRDFWEDIVSDADLARRQKYIDQQNSGIENSYYISGNPLLATQGKVGREFVSLIQGREMVEETLYERRAEQTMLATLQNDILDLLDRTEPHAEKLVVEDDDRSIQMHSCHSRIREVQVLYDRLLEIFENISGVKPSDILVMAPVIEEYSSSIRSVFDGAQGKMFIPWSLADRSIRGEDLLADAFLSLFELCQGRFRASEVISFLETEAVLRRFDIDTEELVTVRQWVDESGIRWGLDSENRHEFSPVMGEEHSWDFGLKRLFMGYFAGRDKNMVQGIAPAGAMAGNQSLLLGRLAEFLENLHRVHVLLKKEKNITTWTGEFLRLLDVFFDPGNDENDQQALARLREAICSLDDDAKEAGFDQNVTAQVMQEYFKGALSQTSSGQAFLSGRVTFCNMVPMRSVPFKVICLLGMNDSDYPRKQSSLGFDLVTRNPLPGDRNRRDDDRYLFLEALMSARQTLYVSWQGRNQVDNSVRPASVVVSELQDYMSRSFVNSSGKHLTSDEIIVQHPLQPFSRKCFDGTPGSASYAGQWLPIGADREMKPFVDRPLQPPSSDWQKIDMQQLLRFWAHPVRYFLQYRLGMDIHETDDLLEDSETFQPDFLDRYLLTERFVRNEIETENNDLQFSLLQAEGRLPHGNFARNYYETLADQAGSMVPLIRPLLRGPRESLEVEMRVGDFSLTGWLKGLYEYGCVRYRPARIKGKDLLKLWVEHLVYNALAEEGGCRSIFVGKGTKAELSAVINPVDELNQLLDLYWQGMSVPLHFYPETSWTWFNKCKENRNASQARQEWYGNMYKRGEGEGFEYRVALQGQAPLDEVFENLATQVFAPLCEHLELSDA